MLSQRLKQCVLLSSTAILGIGIAASLVGTAKVSQANPAIASFQTKATPKPSAAPSFQVIGTEPFWGITVKPNGIVYSTPDSPQITFPYVAPLAAQGRPADLVRVYRLQGRTPGTLVIRRGACNDGMSDRKYDYNATLVLGNNVREGCASQLR